MKPISQVWLWPSRTIGKQESRELADEHNALVNSHDMLVAALREMTATYEEMHGPCSLVLDARKALAAVEGGEE